jgi:hypothetical protein
MVHPACQDAARGKHEHQLHRWTRHECRTSEPDFPLNLSLKLKLVEEIASCLKMLGKQVSVEESLNFFLSVNI